MASYSGPRADNAATFCSTADDTAAAMAGGGTKEAAGAPAGTGVGSLRAIGAPGIGSEGGTRGTTGRGAVGTAGVGATTGVLATTGATGPGGTAGADGVGANGARTGTAALGAGTGLGCGWVAETGGFPATGGLTEGNPIIVRAICGRTAAGTGTEVAGCGVLPLRTAGIPADGRAPGIREGRGDGCAGGGVAPAGGIVRIPLGRVAGLAPHAGAGGVGAGPRSMVISP